MVDHRYGKGDVVARFDHHGLAIGQLLEQGEVEWFDDDFSFIVIIFVATIFTVTGNIIINEELVFIDLVGVGVDVFLWIAGIIRCSGNLRPVDQFGVGGERVVDRQDNIGTGRSARGQCARQGGDKVGT